MKTPHTRGQLFTFVNIPVIRGITPAYAGTTIEVNNYTTRQRDHPRIRGDNTKAIALDTSVLGSPPHTRGQPLYG